MRSSIGWARVVRDGVYPLRRGAWYPVVNDKALRLVIVDVGRKNVAVPRERLMVRRHRPEHWSLVLRRPNDANPVRGTGQDLGSLYAVCPISRTRVRVQGRPVLLGCPDCGHRADLDWEDLC